MRLRGARSAMQALQRTRLPCDRRLTRSDHLAQQWVPMECNEMLGPSTKFCPVSRGPASFVAHQNSGMQFRGGASSFFSFWNSSGEGK